MFLILFIITYLICYFTYLCIPLVENGVRSIFFFAKFFGKILLSNRTILFIAKLKPKFIFFQTSVQFSFSNFEHLDPPLV